MSVNVHTTLDARVGPQRMSGHVQTESGTEHNKTKSQQTHFMTTDALKGQLEDNDLQSASKYKYRFRQLAVRSTCHTPVNDRALHFQEIPVAGKGT